MQPQERTASQRRRIAVSDDSSGVENLIQSSTNYDQFSFLVANRNPNRGHIEAIKKAFEEHGNLTQKQPILVNDQYKIVDGQHRFTACKELGLPIYFTMQRGLGVKDARSMNILQRPWRVEDYALSYSESGDTNYTKFLQISEDYGLNFTITLLYIVGERTKGMFNEFRNGEFVFRDVPAARARLDKLVEVMAHAHNIGKGNQNFAYAYLMTMKVTGFDQRRLIRKLDQVGDNLVRSFASIADYQRSIEEVYNYQMSEANRLRLY